MVVEKWKDRDAEAVYRRLRERGRGTPDGLEYVGSWVEANFDRCWQLMECDDVRLLQDWVLHWRDLGEFEIVPVASGKDTAERVQSRL
jgi:hypothetical protein